MTRARWKRSRKRRDGAMSVTVNGDADEDEWNKRQEDSCLKCPPTTLRSGGLTTG
ncbi:hypothetical protein SESBI_02974 [Sesbania bispinosa]|nr:hypothetical protein SESBI_02974 [Sesbania bispinosa]